MSEKLTFFQNERHPIKPAFERLPFGEVMPAGWIKDMMVHDLTEGFVSQLDVLVPVLLNDDLYNSTRRSKEIKPIIAGEQEMTGEEWEISMRWWAGESQGNWIDGFMCHAFMTGNEKLQLEIDRMIDYYLSTQDENGYFGIYTDNIRFQHEGSNGELWTQAVMYRMLLAYYEITQKEHVLAAVQKGLDVTIERYNQNTAEPFDVNQDFGGVTHGLMMTDICETIFRITGDQKYENYAVFLYKNFSEHDITRIYNDMRYPFVMDKAAPFEAHSAHTYEQLRTLLMAYHATGYDQLKTAYENALGKLANCILPSGAGFGDEWLGGNHADADFTAAEYCGMIELRDFYISAMQKTGDTTYADRAEKVTFNAMMGARHPDGKSITYCKTDNCHVLNNKSPHSQYQNFDFRYKYSPTHADAAVCCNPNYGRNLPQYLSGMWLKAEDGFVAALYGPSMLNTSYKGVAIEIESKTNYPLSDQITFVVNPEVDLKFKLYFRRPAWSKSLTISVTDAKISEKDGFYMVEKVWSAGETVKLTFENDILLGETQKGERYYQRGPLVYALEIPHRIEITKEYGIDEFTDFHVYPTDDHYQKLETLSDSAKQDGFQFQHNESTETTLKNGIWYANEHHLSGFMYNNTNNKTTRVRLKPMGSTILRKVTFQQHA